MSSDDDDDEIEAKNENLKQLYWWDRYYKTISP